MVKVLVGATMLPASLGLLPSSLSGCWQAVVPVGGQIDTSRRHWLSTADSLQFYPQAHIGSHIRANQGVDAGRDWGQEEKGTPEDEMAGWHH